MSSITKFSLMTSALVGLCMISSVYGQLPPSEDKETIAMSKEKQQVKDLLESIETGDPKPAGVINPDKYIQHNLAVADGIRGFVDVLKLLPPDSAKVNTVRVFQDGEFVFTHTDYDFFGPKIGFDIFRFEDGKIVEHWDTIETIPEKRDWKNENGKF
jgi:predicted SnoaL-like aldol condensation-catalyzing enzyme